MLLFFAKQLLNNFVAGTRQWWIWFKKKETLHKEAHCDFISNYRVKKLHFYSISKG